MLRMLMKFSAAIRSSPIAASRAGELIEIVLAGGDSLGVGAGVQAATLRLVLDILERR